MAVRGEGWTGRAGFGGVLPSALVSDYQLYQWARLWWGHAFVIKMEAGKCKAIRRDGLGELVSSSWCDMKWLLADEWCERPVDAASWVDETLLAGACL
jgi:hypothetical protein